ncbi:MAG TPA: AAA family ATPase [Bacillota bacterium]|nr:AAA family ATPase [Bacillota bacterium]
MEIRSVTIYGFGKWIDYTVDFGESAFVCIYGENESGKSTLYQFILFVLFGLPPKWRKFYRPKTSSQMGGSLTVFDPDIGEVTIERLDHVENGAARCYTPDGQQFDERWLHKKLGGIQRKTYQAIFSFSARDLVHIARMKEEDIGEVLLGIGLTGSKYIYDIEKQLDKKIGERFKPYGTKPVMNQQIELLNKQFHDLLTAKTEESHYRHKQEKRRQLTDKISQLREKLRAKKESVLQVEKKLQALPYAYEYRSYIEQLQRLPNDTSVPEHGEERVQALKEKILPLQSELSILQTNEQTYKKKMMKLQASLGQVTNSDEARNILKNKPTYENNRKRIYERKQMLTKLNARLDSALSELNIDLSRNDVRALHIPFHLEKMWNELKNDTEHLSMEYDQLQQERGLLIHKKEYWDQQLRNVKNKQLSSEHTRKLQKIMEEYEQQRLLEKLQADASQKVESWEREKKDNQKRHTIVLVISFVIAVVFWMLSRFLSSSFAGNVSIISLIIGGLQWLWGQRMLRHMEKMIHQPKREAPSQHVPEQEQAEAERLLMRNQDAINEQRTIDEQLKTIDVQLMQWDEKHRLWKQKNARLQQYVREYYESYPFLQSIDVIYWPEIYQSLKSLRQMGREVETHQQEVERFEAHILSYEEKVNAFCEDSSIQVEQSLPLKLEKIEALVREWKRMEDRIEQYNAWILENRQRERQIQQEIQTYQKEIDRLLHMAGVDTEDEFYKRVNQVEKREQLLKEKRKINNQFSRIFTSEEWQQFIEETPKENTLEVNYQQDQQEIERLEQQIDHYRQKKADLNAELMKMESSEAYSLMMHQFQMEKETFNRTAIEWAILKTAKEMLLETKRIYRDKYLQEVMKQTTKYFKVLTNHKYIHVHPPADDQPFLVTAHNRIQYTVNELSQGTIDQLYISLRFAVSEVMSEDNRLPFVIDDGFINFDDVRTERMIDIIASTSDHQQIILFTCKKDLYNQLRHDAKVIDLSSMTMQKQK